jgi:hypothetical protein
MKEVKKHSNGLGQGHNKSKFDMLYFKFESSFGCKFKMEVTFPDEDDL